MKMPFSFEYLLWRLRIRRGPPPGVTEDSASSLFNQGVALAEEGKVEEALRIAEELKGYRYTGGFEVEAMALNEAGDREAAIDALRRGLHKKRTWRLGHLLAIYLSDEGRYEEALEAFDDSLDMLEPERGQTMYNKAITLNRMRSTDEAIELLRQFLESGELTREEPNSAALAAKFYKELTGNSVGPAPPRRKLASPPAWRRRG